MYILLLDILRRLTLTGRFNKPRECLRCQSGFLLSPDVRRLTKRPWRVLLTHVNGVSRGEARCMNATLHAELPRRVRWEMKSGSVPQVPVTSPFTGWSTGTFSTGPWGSSASRWAGGASWWAAGWRRGRCSRTPATAALPRPAQEMTCASWTCTSVSEVSGPQQTPSFHRSQSSGGAAVNLVLFGRWERSGQGLEPLEGGARRARAAAEKVAEGLGRSALLRERRPGLQRCGTLETSSALLTSLTFRLSCCNHCP